MHILVLVVCGGLWFLVFGCVFLRFSLDSRFRGDEAVNFYLFRLFGLIECFFCKIVINLTSSSIE